MKTIAIEHKHPKELLFFGISRTLERMSFYGTRSFLILYLTSNNFNLSEKESVTIYSWFTLSLLVTPIIGALIGDLKIGNQSAIITGLILQIIGTFLLLVSNNYSLYASLFILCLGNGLYTPNFNALFGRNYYGKLELYDGGFSILYILTYIGIFLAPLIMNYVSPYNLKFGILLSGLILIASLFFTLKLKITTSSETDISKKMNADNWKTIALVIIGVSLFWAVSRFLTNYFIEMGTSNYNASFNFNIVDAIAHVILGVIACFIWTKYFVEIFTKLKFALFTIALATILFSLIHYFAKPTSIFYNYIPLLLIGMLEIVLAPLVYSALIKNSSSKYLAIILSCSFIPSQLFQKLMESLETLVELNPISILIFLISAIFVFLFILHKYEKLQQDK